MRALITRPEPDAGILAATLIARGHEPVLAPLLEIRLTEAVPPEDLSGATLLFTSANGVRAAQTLGIAPAAPVYVVGPATAGAAQAAGYAIGGAGDGDVEALCRLVAARLPKTTRLIHISGTDTAGDLTGALARHGYSAKQFIAYRAVAATTLPAPAAEFLRGEAGAALLFSPRTAAALTRLVANAGLAPLAIQHRALALSAAVAAEAKKLAWRTIEVAVTPDTERLLALL